MPIQKLLWQQTTCYPWQIFMYIWHVFLPTSACMINYLTFVIFMFTIPKSIPKTFDKPEFGMWHIVDLISDVPVWKPMMLIQPIHPCKKVYLHRKIQTTITFLIDRRKCSHSMMFITDNMLYSVFWLYISKWSFIHSDYMEHNKLGMCKKYTAHKNVFF